MIENFIHDREKAQAINFSQTKTNKQEVTMHEETQQGISQKVLFIPDLEKMIGRNRVTLRRWWLTDKFPRPVKLNGTTLAWHSDEIEQWLEQNILYAERDVS